MWFSEKALVFVDTRSAALAVYRRTVSGPRLLRFASERFVSHASQGALFSDVLADSRDAISRLARSLTAPLSDATILLPIGAAFPSVIDVSTLQRGQTLDVSEADLVRFRLGSLLPFPVAQAEVRAEAAPWLGSGVVLAQAILKSTIAGAETVMDTLEFKRVRVTSTLSAALRGLSPRASTVDLILGDSATAVAVRDGFGTIQAIHLRLLLEGEDRAERSVDEAVRAAPGTREIRMLGEAVAPRGNGHDVVIHPGFEETLGGTADPQQFPFLGVFQGRPPR